MTTVLPHGIIAKIQYKALSPGCWGSVDSVPACEPKGCWFDAQSRAYAWVAGQVPSWWQLMYLTHIDVSLHLLLLPFPSLKNKQINKII